MGNSLQKSCIPSSSTYWLSSPMCTLQSGPIGTLLSGPMSTLLTDPVCQPAWWCMHIKHDCFNNSKAWFSERASFTRGHELIVPESDC